MKVELIYATWPRNPGRTVWHLMADTVRKAQLKPALKKAGLEAREHVLAATGDGAGELRAAFDLAAQIAARVKAAHEAGALAVIICGSCAVASLGAVSGLGEDTSILWMDAHADLNTPDTTMSGMFDGMAAAIVLGDAWHALAIDVAGLSAASRRNFCLYGARDIDPPEQAIIDDDGIVVANDAEIAIEALEGAERLYIHVDMDVHDASRLRANRFAGEGGPSPEQVRADLVAVTAALPLAAIAITGLDPEIGKEDGAVACAVAHIKAVCESWAKSVAIGR
ncbi:MULTISPECIES: arginase family protein [Rhodomicrobium]|uniref:arginase family protein n=1 Tax=Rhodomicrobium TaxID=1068 RepID=UPI000B4B4BB6|nr:MULTISPECIES: arginase family protein [Rhodomicrobium]